MTALSTIVLREIIPRTPIFTTADVAKAASTTSQLATRRLRRMEAEGLLVKIVRGLWGAPTHTLFSPYAVVPHLLQLDTSLSPTGAISWNDPIDVDDDDDDDGPTSHTSTAQPSLMVPVGVAGYVSFISALHLTGMKSQIPREIHVAVRVQRASVVTPVGTYRFHRIGPQLFGGVEPGDRWGRFYRATPAKALVDTFYASAHRGRRFSHLPEIELPYLDLGALQAAPAGTDPTSAAITGSVGRKGVDARARFVTEMEQWIARITVPRIRGVVRSRWEALLPTLDESP